MKTQNLSKQLLLTGAMAFILNVGLSLGAKAQDPPKPPPPPPSPKEVGAALQKINPFKKKNVDAAKSKVSKEAQRADSAHQAAPPPPAPPNPLDLFKKKKKP